MKQLQNLTLPTRMALGFGSVLTMLAAVVAVALLAFDAVSDATGTLIDDDWVKAEAVSTLEGVTRANARRTMELLISDDPARLAMVRERIAANRTTVDEALATLERLVRRPEARELLAQIQQARKAYVASFRQVDAEVAAGQRDAAVRRVQSETLPRLDTLQEHTGALARLQKQLARDGGAAVRADIRRAEQLMLGLGLVTLLIGAGFALVLARSVTRPVADAVQLARRVAGGDLSASIQAQGRDEIATLVRTLGEMTQRLARVVGQVRGNAESVATASAQIAQGNADLSQRTEEQASALQQTAASMEQLGSTVSLNADNARQANQLALGASQVAQRGGEVVGQVVATMEGIHDSSRRIGDIIGTIDGIASRPTSWRSTRRWRPPAPANRAAASRWWPARCAAWRSAAPRRRARSSA